MGLFHKNKNGRKHKFFESRLIFQQEEISEQNEKYNLVENAEDVVLKRLMLDFYQAGNYGEAQEITDNFYEQWKQNFKDVGIDIDTGDTLLNYDYNKAQGLDDTLDRMLLLLQDNIHISEQKVAALHHRILTFNAQVEEINDSHIKKNKENILRTEIAHLIITINDDPDTTWRIEWSGDDLRLTSEELHPIYQATSIQTLLQRNGIQSFEEFLSFLHVESGSSVSFAHPSPEQKSFVSELLYQRMMQEEYTDDIAEFSNTPNIRALQGANPELAYEILLRYTEDEKFDPFWVFNSYEYLKDFAWTEDIFISLASKHPHDAFVNFREYVKSSFAKRILQAAASSPEVSTFGIIDFENYGYAVYALQILQQSLHATPVDKLQKFVESYDDYYFNIRQTLTWRARIVLEEELQKKQQLREKNMKMGHTIIEQNRAVAKSENVRALERLHQILTNLKQTAIQPSQKSQSVEKLKESMERLIDKIDSTQISEELEKMIAILDSQNVDSEIELLQQLIDEELQSASHYNVIEAKKQVDELLEDPALQRMAEVQRSWIPYLPEMTYETERGVSQRIKARQKNEQREPTREEITNEYEKITAAYLRAMIARNLYFRNEPINKRNVQNEFKRILEAKKTYETALIFSGRNVVLAAHSEEYRWGRARFGSERVVEAIQREQEEKGLYQFYIDNMVENELLTEDQKDQIVEERDGYFFFRENPQNLPIWTLLSADTQNKIFALWEEHQGGGSFELIRPEEDIESLRQAKESVRKRIAQSQPPLTFMFRGHGSPDAIYFSDGQDPNLIDTSGEPNKKFIETEQTIKITAEEFAEYLIARSQNLSQLSTLPPDQQDIFIFINCYNSNFIRKVEKKVRGKISKTIMIGGAEYGQSTFSDESYENKVLRDVMGLTFLSSGNPLSLREMMDKEMFSDSNPSFYIIGGNEAPMQISENEKFKQSFPEDIDLQQQYNLNVRAA